MLLSHGAQVNARDRERHTPLVTAVREAHAEMAEVLRRRGGAE